MIEREKILESIKYVVNNSSHVYIDDKKIKDIIPILEENKKTAWLDSSFLEVEKFTEEQVILYMLLCESLNFCYWDSNIKWKIEYNGEWYSGSFGLFYAISKAIKNGYNLLDINYLDRMTEKDLDSIFCGTTSIPLLKERYEILKGLVSELKNIPNLRELFNVESDIELLNVIVDNFSNFRDISNYKGKDIYFYKRAILLVGDLILNVDCIKNKINNDDNMLACADYKIPQLLRHFGILNYSNELVYEIDNKHLIPHDSEMEIEIRANMIYAIELIKKELQKNGINMNSVQIDNSLWLLSKNKEYKDKPHHLTKTIYY